MKRSLVIIVLIILCLQVAIAQVGQNKPLNGLRLTWKMVTNSYENKSQSRSALVFNAVSDWKFPAKGWKIYFNFSRQIIPNSMTSGLQVQHINGDFFSISPTADFKGIDSGSSLSVEFTSTEWMVNFTDAPEGFYLVWDNEPGITHSINHIYAEPSTKPGQLMRSAQDKVEVANALSIFAQNKLIQDIPADSLIRIFPTPVSYHEVPGNFILDGAVTVQSAGVFRQEAQYLQQTLAGLVAPVNSTHPTPGKVIILQEKPMGAEAYELSISNKQIIISAADGAGIFYGIQSLKTLIDLGAYRQKQKTTPIKNVVVSDKPRFGYRAFMLDVARNFQPKKEILRLLDVMSLYKLNVLHLHLTDDEGWRLEIPGLPELTAVGGRRGHTLTGNDYLQPTLGSGPDINNQHGSGYYTKADFMEILKYAKRRHVRVVPEIESPGHARAAIKAMDARYRYFLKLGQTENAEKYLLHDLHDSSKYQSVQHWNDNVIDVSLPSTYRFINTVTTALVQIYSEAGAPLETIHFGGDEVPAGVWAGSPAFKQLAKTNPAIHSTDDLWPYYYKNIDLILNSHQLYLTAWEETGLVKAMQNKQKVNVINQALLNSNVHLEVWNNVLGWGAEDLAYKQANAGYKVILSCVTNLYFDMASEKAFDEPGYYWGGYADLDKVFKFIPLNYFKNSTEDGMGKPISRAYFNSKEQLTATGRENIIGIQGALWGETLKEGPKRLEYMLLPKLIALGERAWAADPEWATVADTIKAEQMYSRAWSVFLNTIGKRELSRMDHYAGGFNYRIPEPGAMVQNNRVIINAQLPGFGIYYTTDGSMPTLKSSRYSGPIPFSPTLKMALFNNNGRSGRVMVLDK